VPFADYILFRHPTKNRVLLNIGGIANITYLKAGGSIDEVIAFDTGPGNCISDYLCRKHDPMGPGYDVDGERALRGFPDHKLALEVLRSPYFKKCPPKSSDGPEMIALFEQVAAKYQLSLALDDALATAVFITAHSIQLAIKDMQVDEILVSGGGSENGGIRQRFAGLPWNRIAESGAKEALAFALLAAATLDGVPSNVPSVTGARRAVVLGSITPAP
jgi:anhydro-N-acetylmuramic acid kinase